MTEKRLPEQTPGASVFGKVHLGYVVIETRSFSDWRRFGADAIGLHVDELGRGAMRFRLDDHDCRFLLHWGPAEDVTTIGRHVGGHQTIDEIAGRIKNRRVPLDEATSEEAAVRGVERLLRFPGPKGITQEIVAAQLAAAAPLKMQRLRHG